MILNLLVLKKWICVFTYSFYSYNLTCIFFKVPVKYLWGFPDPSKQQPKVSAELNGALNDVISSNRSSTPSI